jgi:hypothetical protein
MSKASGLPTGAYGLPTARPALAGRPERPALPATGWQA